VNTPRAFLALVSDHPLESTVEGEVVSFTSHGAMVSVPVGRGMHVTCYAPLARLAQPAPTRARDVLKKGEHRTFRIVAFDAARRIAELSLL
jgi:ribosomal protein S1